MTDNTVFISDGHIIRLSHYMPSRKDHSFEKKFSYGSWCKREIYVKVVVD